MTTLTANAASKFVRLAIRNRPSGQSGPMRYALAILAIWGVLLGAGDISYAEPPTGQAPETFGYFDFPTCARYALVHSPSLHRSRIDIQLKSVDLKDAHAELLPGLILVSKYYFIRTGDNHWNPFSVELMMTEWDPYLALIKIKSQKILVDIAKISHMDKISEAMATMAKLFLRIHIIDKTLQTRKQLTAVRREKLTYAQARLKLGELDELDVRLLETSLKAESLQIQDLERERAGKIAELKRLMGYHPDQELPLDTRDAVNQVLGGFNGQFLTYAEAQTASKPMRILAKQEQLQSNLVTGSYLSLVPKPMLIFEGLSNNPDRTNGINIAVGASYTLWDGFRKVRDVKRQKMKAEQWKIDREIRSVENYNYFSNIHNALKLCSAKEAFAREKIAVSELNEEKAFLLYKQGSNANKELYSQYLDRRVETVEAQLQSIASVEERASLLIDLASLGGGLERYNARIRY